MKAAEELRVARLVAAQVHARQTDKQGLPYLGHVRRVADLVPGFGDEVTTVAWLHDVCEDNPTGVDVLRGRNFCTKTLESVEAITRRPAEELSVYLQRVLTHTNAATVKRADLIDNSAPDRLSQLPAEVATRLRMKYSSYLHLLGTYSTSSVSDLLSRIDLEDVPLIWADDSENEPLSIYHVFPLAVAESALRLIQEAAVAEPTITATVQSVLPEDARLKGLDCRLKSPRRAAEKLRAQILGGLQANLEDVNRYTVVSSPNDLSGVANTMLEDLRARGWLFGQLKHTYYLHSPYKAVHCRLHPPGPFPLTVEFQFHWTQSLSARSWAELLRTVFCREQRHIEKAISIARGDFVEEQVEDQRDRLRATTTRSVSPSFGVWLSHRAN